MNANSVSLEATGKTVAELTASAHLFPEKTPVNVAWLNNEDDYDRLRTVLRIEAAGMLPVPIIAARRVRSKKHLFDLTEKLRFAGANGHFMVVGGDPSQASGPFERSIELLATDWVEKYQLHSITLPGFPEGNVANGYRTDVPDLIEKVKLLTASGCDVTVTTQLAFDPDKIVRWVSQLRDEGISQLIRIGLPGPTRQDRLLRFARAFGVSIRKLDEFSSSSDGNIDCTGLFKAVAHGLQSRGIGNTALHLYPFGGAAATAEWHAKISEKRLPNVAAEMLA